MIRDRWARLAAWSGLALLVFGLFELYGKAAALIAAGLFLFALGFLALVARKLDEP